MSKTSLLTLLVIVAPLAAQAEPQVIPGATETTPSLSQYFSWINNRNEGATESQTLANLGFFKWMHDEYGMKPDIDAFDAVCTRLRPEKCEVVVLGLDAKALEFTPEVWLTAYPIPRVERELILTR